jgi:lysozyme
LDHTVSDPTRPRLKVSREGIVLIKSFEGFRPRAVRGDDGRWTIGYGHTASAREGLTVGEADAELLLQYDLMPVVKALNDRLSNPLNQHQFDALASFALSVGVERFLSSDVFDQLSAGRAGQAADALIGWPEPASPETALRRRAAERALFVADPAGPVALADLLAAPLPPPPVVAVEPTADAANQARAAAVASLLGEPVAPPASEPEAAFDAAQASPPAVVISEDAEAPGPADSAPAAPVLANLQRYSPYSTAVIGPLPGFPVATPTPAVAPEPEPEPTQTPEAEPAPATEPEAASRDEAGHAPDPAAQDFSPAPSFEAAPFAPTVASIAFPNLTEPLILTPPTEADFSDAGRPVWSPEQRVEAPAESPLFEAEPPLSVLRHEVEPAEPRRFDWSYTGMYMVMGGLGLASCAFSAAAFRLSVVQPSPMGETTVIAWALALIGILCVGVSSWNLYVRWGKGD